MRDYNYRKNWNDLLTPEIVKKLTLIQFPHYHLFSYF